MKSLEPTYAIVIFPGSPVMPLRHRLLVALALASIASISRPVAMLAADGPAAASAPSAAARVAAGELSVVVGEGATPAEKRSAELFAERVQERSGLALNAATDSAKHRLVIGTAATSDAIKRFLSADSAGADLGPDGYRVVVDPSKTEWFVAGESPISVVAGVGRLLREMRYEDAAVDVPALDLTERPQMPNRGVYLWARKYYFDKPDQVDRYIEEFALWGGNAIALWFEMGMFEDFQDMTGEKSELNSRYARQYKLDKSIAKDWIAMYRRFYATARRMGMKTGLLMVANDAYMSSPKELRIKPIIGCPDWYLCPSQPGAVHKLVAWQEEVFQSLAPLDIYNSFPADAGGCSCKECQPWPTGGYWKVAKPLADRIHEISPKTEIWVDTWHLNHPTFGGQDWKNLVAGLGRSKERPEWFAGFEVGLAPHHRFARQSADDRKVYSEAQMPLMVFPDISMWGNHPGMLVNKAYWKELQDEFNDYPTDLLRGGWPYSERWNTDIAIVMFLSWFNDPKTSIDAVLDDWCRCYFGSQAADVRGLLDLLDDSNNDPERKAKIRDLLAKLDGQLPAWAKADWRWLEISQSANRFKTP